MMRKFPLTLAFASVLLAAPTVFAATDLPSVFPGHFGKWNTSSPAIKTKFSEQEAGVFFEAGSADSLIKLYSNGAQSLSLGITAFRDPSGAYQAFTFVRSREMPNAKLTETSAWQEDRALLLVGNFLVRVNGLAPGASEAELNDLAALLRPHADATPLPPMRTYLPVESRVSGSDIYALGPAAFRSAVALLNLPAFSTLAQEAGFTSGAEAMIARYHSGNNSAVLVLIEYPTPQLAEQQRHHLELVLAPQFQKTGIAVERKASLLSIVLGSSSPAYSRGLRNGVDYETRVTWNEPAHTVTDPPILSTMAKIIAGTGVLMGVAVVLGIAFGGVRVVTKALFPGKVFDRPEQIEILQLRLSEKRANLPDIH